DDTDPAAAADPLVGEDLGERPRSITGLSRQAEVLEQVAAQRERRGAGHPETLVADEDRRVAVRAHDEDRLLEPRIEPGEERHRRAVLAVGEDDQPVVATAGHPRSERLDALR